MSQSYVLSPKSVQKISFLSTIDPGSIKAKLSTPVKPSESKEEHFGESTVSRSSYFLKSSENIKVHRGCRSSLIVDVSKARARAQEELLEKTFILEENKKLIDELNEKLEDSENEKERYEKFVMGQMKAIEEGWSTQYDNMIIRLNNEKKLQAEEYEKKLDHYKRFEQIDIEKSSRYESALCKEKYARAEFESKYTDANGEIEELKSIIASKNKEYSTRDEIRTISKKITSNTVIPKEETIRNPINNPEPSNEVSALNKQIALMQEHCKIQEEKLQKEKDFREKMIAYLMKLSQPQISKGHSGFEVEMIERQTARDLLKEAESTFTDEGDLKSNCSRGHQVVKRPNHVRK